MAKGQFNTIVIVDAIPSGELNSAGHLRDELRDISDYHVESLSVRYERVETREDLQASLSDLTDAARRRNTKPWIHIEAHGMTDQSGFVTAEGEACYWAELKDLLIPINEATNLNLVLIIAACYGGHFAKAINTTDRAPVLALVGPIRELTTYDIQVDFQAFYRELFLGTSLATAVQRLTARTGDGLYYRDTAEMLFLEAWAAYKRNHCTKTALRERAREIYKNAKKESGRATSSVGAIKRLLVSREKEVFQKFRDTYFLCDLHSANRDRFSVDYTRAEKYARHHG